MRCTGGSVAWRLCGGLLLASLLLLGSVTQADAVALTNTALTATEFGDIIGAAVAGLGSAFNFAGGPVDGTVTSAVFQGADGAAGYYVYVYQILFNSPAAVPFVQGLTVPFIPDPSATPLDLDGDSLADDTSFWVTGAGPGPVSATWGPSQLTWFSGGWLSPGTTSALFGVVVPQVPTHLVTAQVLDFGNPLTTAPSVYSAVPEASSLLLFATALVGTGVLSRRRFTS
jgi:hypothetical protein